MRTIKDLLSWVRNTQVISDPFPEHSSYEMSLNAFGNSKNFLSRYFGFNPERDLKKPQYVSIHKAYKMGYDKAYQEISDKIGHNKVEGY